MLCLVNDFSAAEKIENLLPEQPRGLAVRRAAQNRASRSQRIVSELNAGTGDESILLAALTILGGESLEGLLKEKLLSRPVAGSNHKAFEILIERNFPALPALLGKALSLHVPTGWKRNPFARRHLGYKMEDQPRKSLVVYLC